ncbi:hypothetical protein KPH14_007585 [Odynerus spinipes]|uniref:DUF4817 domain-containing protein n=1 Tax=Odynerus spinipes TaxID=1348599 RepID=A0AAD9VN36_9HYME|nr:hypothetical protein KPH14_007585 [Odynerus spinipes]
MMSASECVGAILILGRCNENIYAAARLYAETYPDRNAPSAKTIERMVLRARETRSFHRTPRRQNPQAAQRNEANQNAVLAAVTANPQISISRIARNMGIHRSTVHKILQSHKFHPYRVNLVHDLHGEDFNSRIRSCNWFNEKINEDP